MPKKIRLTLPDDIAAKLDEHVARTGREESDVMVAGFLEYYAACRGIGAGVVPTGPAVVPTGPGDGAVAANQAPTAVYVSGRTPHRGMLPTDTDEIIALLEEVNAMPDHTEVAPDMMILNAVRKADIQRDILRLRAAVTEKRAQAV